MSLVTYLFFRRKIPFKFTGDLIPIRVDLLNIDNSLSTFLAFDTAASTTLISKDIALILGINLTKHKYKTTINTAGGIVPVNIYTISSLSINGLSVKNIDVIVHNIPEESKIDGLIGLNFIKFFNIKINFKKGLLTIYKHKL